MNAQYQWHENVPIVNDYDPARTANLLLPVDAECPAEFTAADFERLYPSGAAIKTVHFFGVHCGWFAVPVGAERCASCTDVGDACDACGGSGYKQAVASAAQGGGA